MPRGGLSRCTRPRCYRPPGGSFSAFPKLVTTQKKIGLAPVIGTFMKSQRLCPYEMAATETLRGPSSCCSSRTGTPGSALARR